MTVPDTAALIHRDVADGIQQQVVGAVIDYRDRVLLLQRPINDFRGGTWELPSGKVERDEDLITALHREVAEETGMSVDVVTAYLGAFDYTSGSGKHTRQHTWSVTVTSTDDVRLTEHDDYSWADAMSDHPVSTEVKGMLAEHFRTKA